MTQTQKYVYSPRLLSVGGGAPRFDHLVIADLGLDHGYQRTLSEGRVEKMVKEWDQRLCPPITVSQRGDGSFFVIDGQHRVEALRRLGRTVVEAWILSGVEEDEDRLFVAYNTLPVRPTAWDTFRARLHHGDPVATSIVRIVEQHGARIALNASREGGRIAAVGALEKVYGASPVLLADTIAAIQSCWPDTKDTWARDGVFIQGMAVFLASYQASPAFSVARMKTRFGRLSALELVQAAKRIRAEQGGVGFSPTFVTFALRDAYNGRATGANRLTGPIMSLARNSKAHGRTRR